MKMLLPPTSLLGLALALALSATGCNSTPAVVIPKPPHGGSLFSEIEGKMLVEIVPQEASAGKVEFVAYFLDDQLTPLVPPPTAASFKPKAPRGAPTVDLKPTGDADPAKSSGMTSPAIDDAGGIAGEISATIDGKLVLFTINAR